MLASETSTYLAGLVGVRGARGLLSELSYHRYGETTVQTLSSIARSAARLGVRTAMLEHVKGDVEELFTDLTVAQASAWQQYTLAFSAKETGAQYFRLAGGNPVIASRTRALRQYFRYVRAGAVRIGAKSDAPSVRPVAFQGPADRFTVVLHVDRPAAIAIGRVPAGSYAATLTNDSRLDLDLGTWTLGQPGELRLDVPAAGVVALFRK
jgi:hypothetical protein